MAINLRSPYYTGTAVTNTASATLDITIWEGSSALTPLPAPQYSLRKSAIGTDVKVFFEISELIRDYIDITFDGDYNGKTIWVNTINTAFDSDNIVINTPINSSPTLALDGYYYFEEAQLPTPPVLISNREIFALDDNAFRIPIYTESQPTVTFINKGKVVLSESFSSSLNSSEQVKYISVNGSDKNWDSFQERVLSDNSASYETNSCIRKFFNTYSIGEVDKVIISSSNSKLQTININLVEECKYQPKKVTFINKFGVLQDMYFFKKSVEEMTVSKESYKSNIIGDYGIYNYTNHVNRDFNVVANESITLSSGYLSEEYNEVFKQLLLSEKVWVTNIIETGEQVLPINVKTSDITYKTSLNDKLVEYTIEFDKSFDTINNIR